MTDGLTQHFTLFPVRSITDVCATVSSPIVKSAFPLVELNINKH